MRGADPWSVDISLGDIGPVRRHVEILPTADPVLPTRQDPDPAPAPPPPVPSEPEREPVKVPS